MDTNQDSRDYRADNESMPERQASYRRLFRRFILYTMVCSVVPILLVGWAIKINYTNFSIDRMTRSFMSQIDHHRKVIQMFINECRSKLLLIAATHKMEDLVAGGKLGEVFEMINRDHMSITDLGVIDDQGNHLNYVGPYDLIDSNYSQALWFKEVMAEGIYISDMFMGFRQEPHFIVAVTRTEEGRKWILRATIDTDFFRSLVENVKIGRTGEVYLVNRDGIFQTSPRFNGKIMGKAIFEVPPRQPGVSIRVAPAVVSDGNQKIPSKIVCQTWLDEPNWMLMVQQDYKEAFDDVNHANKAALIFLYLSAAAILIVTILITRHMIAIIRRRDLEMDQLNRQLLQAGKMASIGELSAGVAHEINNPLAIVLTERQILLDAFQGRLDDDELEEQFLDSMNQIDIQVQRCKRITHNLLRFARRTESVIEPVDVNAFLQEVAELMEREARANGIAFVTDLDEDIPFINSDPSQLQQVFLNLITNAIDAQNQKMDGMIKITTRAEPGEKGLWLTIADTGSGISPENLSKIFDPFFTTKPVGKGTGLGLSICYSIIKRLGGKISVTSEVGQGTEFVIFLPEELPEGASGGVAEAETAHNFQ